MQVALSEWRSRKDRLEQETARRIEIKSRPFSATLTSTMHF